MANKSTQRRVNAAVGIEDDEDSVNSEARDLLHVGARVYLKSSQQVGTIRFYGATSFAGGQWVGIELDQTAGRNDGMVQGRRYFTCPPSTGLFVRPNSCNLIGNALEERPLLHPPRAGGRPHSGGTYMPSPGAQRGALAGSAQERRAKSTRAHNNFARSFNAPASGAAPIAAAHTMRPVGLAEQQQHTPSSGPFHELHEGMNRIPGVLNETAVSMTPSPGQPLASPTGGRGWGPESEQQQVLLKDTLRGLLAGDPSVRRQLEELVGDVVKAEMSLSTSKLAVGGAGDAGGASGAGSHSPVGEIKSLKNRLGRLETRMSEASKAVGQISDKISGQMAALEAGTFNASPVPGGFQKDSHEVANLKSVLATVHKLAQKASSMFAEERLEKDNVIEELRQQLQQHKQQQQPPQHQAEAYSQEPEQTATGRVDSPPPPPRHGRVELPLGE